MNNAIEDIISAIVTLGITGTVHLQQIAVDRIAVYVEYMRYGIWDVRRKTFVD